MESELDGDGSICEADGARRRPGIRRKHIPHIGDALLCGLAPVIDSNCHTVSTTCLVIL